PASRLILVVALLVSASVAFAQPQPQPDYLSWAQPGPYRSPDWTDFTLSSFGASQPIVGTYFFYWFDAEFLRSQSRTFDPFPFHAVDQDTQSFHDPRWYRK